MSAAAAEVEAELARWRDRLAAASRNVSELSELPEYGSVRALASGTGRLADEARSLVATMNELWQGVLLIGAALDQADQAHKAASRLWRPEESAQKVLAILRGPSITVDLSDTPVLHRRLLAGPRHTATVSPDTLLQTMDVAFDRAREQLTRIADATNQAKALRSRLAEAIGRLASPDALRARLDAADLPDPLDRLDALQALEPVVGAERAVSERARAALADARAALAALQNAAAATDAAVSCCAAAVPIADGDAAGLRDLAAWLDRIGRIAEAGRNEAALVGLSNWHAQRARLMSEVATRQATADAANARREELRARLGALRAKHRARPAPDAALEALANAARATLDGARVDLGQAARDLAAYEAALAGR